MASVIDWRPIETAPKDGTRIRILVDGIVDHPLEARWCPDGGGGWPWLVSGSDDRWNVKLVTHWMPLPEAPPA